MNIKKFSLWFIFLIIVGVILGYSTWHQWNANQGTILERMRPIPPDATFAHGGSISYIAFDPKNPDLIACGGAGNIVKVWNRNNHDSPQLTLEAHDTNHGDTYMVGLAFSPIDNWVATKTFWTLEIWDSTTGDKINTLHTPSSNLTISPIGNNIATDDVNLTLWDVNDTKNIRAKILLSPKIDLQPISLEGLERIDPYPERKINILSHNISTEFRNASINNRYNAIDFSHDGKWIAAAGMIIDEGDNDWLQKVKIWDLQKQVLFKIIERDEQKIQEHKQKRKIDPGVKLPTSNDIRSIQFSPDNRFFGLAADNGLTIWSLPEWNIYHEVIDQRISDMAFSPDGTMFAVCDMKGITLWSIETLTPVALLSGGGLLGSSVIAFSHDGNTLASGGYGGVLRLWEVSNIFD